MSGEPANERRGMSSSDGEDLHSPALALALLMSMIRAVDCFLKSECQTTGWGRAEGAIEDEEELTAEGSSWSYQPKLI